MNSEIDFSGKYKILTVQIGRIGDMILTTPLFSELKKLFPNSELSVLSSPINKQVIQYNSSIDKIYLYKKNIFSIFCLIKKLKKVKFDYWIDTKYEYSKTSEFLVKKCKPVKSFGYNNLKTVFDVNICNPDNEKHYVNLNLNVLRNLKPDYSIPINIKPVIEIPENIRKENLSLPNDKLILLINISARSSSRIWQKEKWLELMNRIDRLYKCYFIINCYNKEKQILDYLKSNYKRNNICYRIDNTIYELSDLIKKSNIIITPDTSVVHIASSFDIPVLGLYTNVNWNFERFKPLSSINEIIFSKNENDIFDITVEEVAEKFKKISGNAESRTRVQKEDH